jgi:hypothetical protein
MPLKAHSVWHVLRGMIAAVVLFAGLAAVQAGEMIEGIAVVTSEQGAIQITDKDGRSSSPDLHEPLILNGSRIQTGKGAYLFLALSNGVSIGIGGSSEVAFEAYLQQPFTAKKESILHEPSVSELSIRITTGTLAIVSNQLSPVSQARIYLPTGEIRIHSATCVLQNNDLGTRITACDGTLTYYYPDKTKREFIVEPQSIRISEHSAGLGQTTESTMITSLPEDCRQLAAATQHASTRVFFKASASGGPPQPVLIVSPDYFKQPSARPYEFNE